MTGTNSAISLAASLQVAAAFPSIGIEFNPFQNPLQPDLVSGLLDSREGRMRVLGGPGLGINADN